MYKKNNTKAGQRTLSHARAHKMILTMCQEAHKHTSATIYVVHNTINWDNVNEKSVIS